jgi:hypothetical protein
VVRTGCIFHFWWWIFLHATLVTIRAAGNIPLSRVCVPTQLRVVSIWCSDGTDTCGHNQEERRPNCNRVIEKDVVAPPTPPTPLPPARYGISWDLCQMNTRTSERSPPTNCHRQFSAHFINGIAATRIPCEATATVSCEVWTAHSVAARSVRFSQQTAAVSPHSINRLGSVAETWCVSCEVRTAHTVYLCVPYGSQSKQRLFPHTALTDLAL